MFWKRLDQPGHVPGHADRLGQVAQGVFGDRLFSGFAEDQANGRLVIGVTHLVVHRRQVKIHLPGKFRFEPLDFQIDHDVAAEAQVIEEQIDEEFFAVDFEAHLLADEGEAGPSSSRNLRM